jgi:hypothetical protein
MCLQFLLRLQCQLKMYAVVIKFLMKTQPELLRPLATSHPGAAAPDDTAGSSTGTVLGTGLLHILNHLRHNRTFAALRQSAALSEALGWEWGGSHLTALGQGAAEPCWDAVAVLRVLMHEKATSGYAEQCANLFGSLTTLMWRRIPLFEACSTLVWLA